MCKSQDNILFAYQTFAIIIFMIFNFPLNSNIDLTLKGLFISESCIEIKIDLNFYFQTSLWCLKRFYEGL